MFIMIPGAPTTRKLHGEWQTREAVLLFVALVAKGKGKVEVNTCFA